MSGTPPTSPPGGAMPTGAPLGSQAGGNYAGWFLRVVAYIIDVIPAAILSGIGYLLAGPQTETTTVSGVEVTTTTGLGLVYWLFWGLGVLWIVYNKGYLEGTTTQSIGKKVLGMHTVGQMTGQPIGFATAFGRLLLLWLDFAICYVGVLWPIWDQNKQCLISDKATKAVVYKD